MTRGLFRKARLQKRGYAGRKTGARSFGYRVAATGDCGEQACRVASPSSALAAPVGLKRPQRIYGVVSLRACCTFVAGGKRCMHNSDYYREQAAKYRELAEGEKDAAAKQEFLELAAACEEAADKIDDCRASG